MADLTGYDQQLVDVYEACDPPVMWRSARCPICHPSRRDTERTTP